MIKQHATQSVRDHHLMNELVGYAGLFINLQKGCFPEAKKQRDCAHMNIYRTKGRCQHTFRQWSISLVTQQLGEKQIGPIWWISVALIKGILPFHRRNENLVASLLICSFSLQKTGFCGSFCWFVHLQRHWVFVDSSFVQQLFEPYVTL